MHELSWDNEKTQVLFFELAPTSETLMSSGQYSGIGSELKLLNLVDSRGITSVGFWDCEAEIPKLYVSAFGTQISDVVGVEPYRVGLLGGLFSLFIVNNFFFNLVFQWFLTSLSVLPGSWDAMKDHLTNMLSKKIIT